MLVLNIYFFYRTQQPATDSSTANVNKPVIEILPHILSLTDAMLAACRSNILYQIQEASEGIKKYTSRDFLVLDEVICMSGAPWANEASLISLLPNNVRSVLDKWKAINVSHVPWVCINISSIFESLFYSSSYEYLPIKGIFYFYFRTPMLMTLFLLKVIFWQQSIIISVLYQNMEHSQLILLSKISYTHWCHSL